MIKIFENSFQFFDIYFILFLSNATGFRNTVQIGNKIKYLHLQTELLINSSGIVSFKSSIVYLTKNKSDDKIKEINQIKLLDKQVK